jgi:hypothetical protein
MKYFIIYRHGSDRESYSVFYSSLVIAENKESAIEKYCLQENGKPKDEDWEDEEITAKDFEDEYNGYGIRELIPIT